MAVDPKKPVANPLEDVALKMNPVEKRTISLALLAAIAWTNIAIADGPSDVRWWRNIAQEWCLNYKQREFCLPAEYEVRGFESDNAEFGIDSLDKPSSLIDYEFGSAQKKIDFLLDDSDDPLWQLKSSQVIGDIVVTRIEPRESRREEAHGLKLSIIEFAGLFMLTINSDDPAAHTALPELLTAQWLGNTDN